MAQIIRLRRGTLAQLNSVTLQNGEIGIVTGSAVIGDAALKTAAVIGHSDGTNRLTIARIIKGNATPDLSGVTGGAAFNDMLYHETDAKALKVLNTGGNTTLDLSANISVSEITGNISGSVTSTGSFGYLNVEGDGVIKGNLTFGDADTDSIAISADITSNLIPNASDTYNLGSTSQRWNDLYLSGSISASGGPVDIDSATTVDIDAVGALSLQGGAASDLTTGAGAITVDGKTGITLKEDGTAVIAIDTNRDVLFSHTGGSSGDPDVEIDGYLVVDGTAEFNGTVDIDGTVDVDNDSFSVDSSAAISLDAGATSNLTTSAGDIDINAAANLDLDGATVDIDSAGALSLQGGAASDLTTGAGAITVDGKIGVDIKEDGTSVITIDTNRDTLFASTGGSTSDPDVEFDGYTRFDGVAEITLATDSTSVTTGALIVDGGVGIAKNLVVGGNVTAQEFHTEFVSASIVYDSGSTKFGDSIDDIHSFSGSINLSGSFNHNDGNMTITDTLTAATVDINGGAVDGTTIGASSHTTIKGTTIDATTDFTIDGLVITADTITNDAGLSIVASSGDITLDPAGNNVLPGGDSADDLGVSGTAWRALYVDSIKMNGQGSIDGATHITGSGNLEVAGNISGSVSTTGSFGRTSTTTLDLSKIVGNWTNAGNTIADLGSVTTVDINAGTVDAITSLTVANNVDIGAYDLRAATITPDGLTSGRVVFAGTAGVLSDDSDLTFSGATLTATNITGTTIKDFTTISGSVASTGSFSELRTTGVGGAVAASSASLVAFQNTANNHFGRLASADSQATTVGVVAYNTSGNLTVSSVIDGGSF